MKKVTGIFFIAAAVLLLGSSFKPLVDEMPRLTKIDAPIQKFVDEMPRLTKIEEPVQKFVDELPRLT